MATGLFLYPLFVALSESFDLNTHYYLPRPAVITTGTVFMVISIVFFPLASYLAHIFAVKCETARKLGKKLMIAYIFSAGLSETIAVFGLIIYIVSADLKYFYLFFVLSFVHLILHRPKRDEWQKFAKNVSE